jgi:hypothetical protein
MIYKCFAYLVVGFHAIVAVVALAGALLALFNPWLALLHVPLALWVVVAHWMGWTCPLTPLENYLWRAAGSEGYAGTFLSRYVLPAIDTEHESRRQGRSIGLATGLINLALYAAVIVHYWD